jgi:hypothetical protein
MPVGTRITQDSIEKFRFDGALPLRRRSDGAFLDTVSFSDLRAEVIAYDVEAVLTGDGRPKYFRRIDAQKPAVAPVFVPRRSTSPEIYQSNVNALFQHAKIRHYKEHLDAVTVDRSSGYPRVVGESDSSGGSFTYSFQLLRSKHDPRKRAEI